MYKQRYRYCFFVYNYYKRKKQLNYISQIMQKAKSKNYCRKIKQLILSCILVYLLLMLDLDRLVLIKMHQELEEEILQNNRDLSKIITHLDTYELFIIDEHTKHLIISKQATVKQLFQLIKNKCKQADYGDFYIIINNKVYNYKDDNLMKQTLLTLNVKCFDNIYIHHYLKGGGINQKRLQSGKYEEDDSEVDSEIDYHPPPKKRKIESYDKELQRHSIKHNIFNSRSKDDEYQSYLKNHNINVRTSLSDESISHTNDSETFDINDYCYDYNISDNADSEDSNYNTIIYDYKPPQTLELNEEDETTTEQSENVENNRINHQSRKYNRCKKTKQRIRRLRRRKQQFTNDQWRKKIVKQLKHTNFKYRMNDGQLKNIVETDVKEHYTGKMEHICPHCCAKLYKKEMGTGQDKWKFCCKQGAIKLKRHINPPRLLKNLFTGSSELAKFFQHHIQRLNSALAMSSSNLKSRHYKGKFILAGRAYHSIPEVLLPDSENVPQKAQIYTWDPEFEMECRLNPSYMKSIRDDNRTRQLLQQLQTLLCDHNWLVKTYRNIYSEYIENNTELKELHLKVHSRINDKTNLGHYKTYVKPSKNSKIATLIKLPDISENRKVHQSFFVTTKSDEKHKRVLNETSGLCDPFCFPLFYPYGEIGYQIGIKDNIGKKITMTRYYRYKLFERQNKQGRKLWNPFLYGKRLFHLWVTNQWAKIQQEKLNFLVDNQSKLRAESYDVIKKARKKNKNLKKLGRKVNIIPGGSVESPRYFRTKYQNALAILRQFGTKPDLFITFTANPDWKEVVEALEDYPTLTKDDRDDVIARVFNIKLRSLLADLMKHDVLGMSIKLFYFFGFCFLYFFLLYCHLYR